MSYDYGLMNLNKIIEYAVYFDVGMENRGVCVVVQSQAGAPPICARQIKAWTFGLTD